MTQIRIPAWVARVIMVFAVIVLIAVGLVSIVLVPVVLVIMFVIALVRSIVTGGRGAISDAKECPACGFWLTGQGERGVCPNCNTVYGVDLEVRQESTAEQPPLLLPPADRDERRPGG